MVLNEIHMQRVFSDLNVNCHGTNVGYDHYDINK